MDTNAAESCRQNRSGGFRYLFTVIGFIMAKKPATFSYSSFIAEKRESLRDARVRLQQVEKNKGMVQLAAAMLETVAKRAKLLGKIEWANMSAYGYNDGTLNVSAVLEIPCTSLKEGVIPEVLSAAMAAGFEPMATDDTVYSWSAARNYRFAARIDGMSIEFNIKARVAEDADGATCRKVATGVKLEEVTQYELVCD